MDWLLEETDTVYEKTGTKSITETGLSSQTRGRSFSSSKKGKVGAKRKKKNLSLGQGENRGASGRKQPPRFRKNGV